MENFDIQSVFRITDQQCFNDLALQIFQWQYKHCQVYRDYILQLGTDVDKVTRIGEIPFLPVEIFKYHEVIAVNIAPEIIFQSSSTTGSVPSRHLLADIDLYLESFTRGFELAFGDPKQYCILALLPSYLERGNSSLVYMVNELIRLSGDSASGFYLDQHEELLRNLENAYLRKKVILVGVTFALLDLVDGRSLGFPELMVIETGGMKGRREEMIREDLHRELKRGFGIDRVCSEYGMTELLSQAYSVGDGRFSTPPWMKVMVRDLHDPFAYLEPGKTGPLNIIDLANIYSCSFIETQDLGRIHTDGTFEVLGRVDNSDIRGCSLLIS